MISLVMAALHGGEREGCRRAGGPGGRMRRPPMHIYYLAYLLMGTAMAAVPCAWAIMRWGFS